jgi:ferredoxin
MAHVVTDNCINCKHTDCIEVCRVDAIFQQLDAPVRREIYLALNAELASNWPVPTSKIAASDDAEMWDGVPNMLPLRKPQLDE